MSRRVVITGLGPITAFGVGIGPLWEAMVQGRSAVRRITRFDPGGYQCQVAAELDPAAFDVKAVVPKSYRKATKVMCRDVELAVGGARAAVADAGLNTKGMEGMPGKEGGGPPAIPPERLGCHIGAGLICAEVDELTAAIWTSRGENGDFDLKHWGREGMNNLTPLWLLKYLPNMLACHVTIIHDCRGPSNTITCCEASSGLSIGESMRVIHRGSADACLSGGAESKVNPMAMMRQTFAGRLSPAAHDCEPASVLRPFDPQASGTVLGEGGGLVVVEAADVAQRRGKSAYAEITGFACTQSYCADTVGLEAEPQGIADAIELALGQAGAGPEAIDAIVPLGSSIPGVDRAEAAAIERVFGERARRIPLVTTIPNTGNCNAGAGAVAVSVAAMSLREQTLPARLNTASSNGLDAAACPARPAALRHVLVFQTSQGGQNVALVLKKA
jgi:3-oxoacyl-[acyl-carrier-protein] synthase II